MIQLHIYLDALPGDEKALEQTYRTAYVPAITVQDGFVSTALLKASNAVRRYQIDIAFDSEEKRLKWVASREHQACWPKVEALCHTISWQGFEVIA
jgi:heme-degrading monooxygenase HmoA